MAMDYKKFIMKFLSHELIYKRKKFKPGNQCVPRTACAWFLKIDPMQIVCMCVCLCVCVCVRAEAINN